MKTASSRAYLPLTVSVAIFALAAIFVTGCGGGSGGGGGKDHSISFNGGSWESNFFLQDVHFGRALVDGQGIAYQVINPLTYVEVDPITGILLPGYPRLLFEDDELGNLMSLNLVDNSIHPYNPKIVPRNACLQLLFSQPVDPNSLHLDADSHLTADSPIQIYDRTGNRVPLAVTCQGNILILNPLVDGRSGFSASPLNFDEHGVPVGDPDGYLGLVCFSMGTGPNVVESAAGLELGGRADGLGTLAKPVGFNPGNNYLDFISFGDLTFNGFLPDLVAPRIIREVRGEGVVDSVGFAGSSIEIGDSAATYNVTANGGDGEWAAAVLTLRPGTATEAKLRVLENRESLLIVGADDEGLVYGYPAVGDDYLLQRAEFFEPIFDFGRPETAVDPENHPRDPNDPEDQLNSELFRFLLFDEWTGSGWERVDFDEYGNPDHPIESAWRIGMRFSEPMDVTSCRPYDSFYIARDIGPVTDPLLGQMQFGRVTGAEGQTVIFFEPVHEDQFGLLGGDTFRGFGRDAKNLRLVVRTVPPPRQAEAFYESLGDPQSWPPEAGIVEDLEDEGVLGLTDLGGQPLGLPDQFFDKGDLYCVINEGSPGRGPFPPAVDFPLSLSCSSDPSLVEIDAVIHRFMGLPESAADPVTGATGVVYRDHDDEDGTHSDNEIYGPHIADIHIDLSGVLRGHSVDFIEHVFDDLNPPIESSPSYPDPIFKMPFGAGTPINASEGVRFQQVYRRGEASPDVPLFAGTILDLVGLAWAPIGGNVTNAYLKEMSIAVCLSSLNIDSNVNGLHDDPDTRESGGIPTNSASGLKRKFDSYRGTWGDYREENPPIQTSNVFDSDGDNSLRDEWAVVLGNSIDIDSLNADPPGPYADGRSYLIDSKNLYAPKNQGTKFNFYIDYPTFDNPVDAPGYGYDSTRGMLIDIRTDDNDGHTVPLTNGYTFHAAIMSSVLPRFRGYARGNTTSTPLMPPPRIAVYAATDPYDELNPPVDTMGQPDDARSWNRAWDNMLLTPSLYGDNSRYFMIFNYAKRVSTISSPWIRVKPSNVVDPEYLPPVIKPPLDDVEPGTNVTVWFRASSTDSELNATDWVLPEEIGQLNGQSLPFIQFKVTFEGNTTTGEVPVIDEIIIPYNK